MPEKFEIITTLMPEKTESHEAAYTISEVEEQANALEKYGIIYLTNTIVFLLQNADLI